MCSYVWPHRVRNLRAAASGLRYLTVLERAASRPSRRPRNPFLSRPQRGAAMSELRRVSLGSRPGPPLPAQRRAHRANRADGGAQTG
jgi:hypothetical protein